jgi:hypothetical protein
MAVDSVDVLRYVVLGREAEARDAADDAFRERPGELRARADLVIEADGHQGAHLVEHTEGVPVDGWPRVLAADDLPVLGRTLAGADVDLAVDGDEAVRAVARDAVQTARAVVLERAREDAHAVAVQRRGDRVARLDRDVATLECDAHAEASS